MDKRFDTKVRKALKIKEREVRGNLALIQNALAKFQPPQPTQRRKRRRRKVTK